MKVKNMKTIMLLTLVSTLGAAQDRSSAVAVANKTAASSATPGIPKGATEVEPNLFRYADAHGKFWFARVTPFGISAWEDKPALSVPVIEAKDSPPPKTTDLGDSIRFEKKSPFGETTWVKKKSELTDEERDWLAHPAGTQAMDNKTASPGKSTQPAGEPAGKR